MFQPRREQFVFSLEIVKPGNLSEFRLLQENRRFFLLYGYAVPQEFLRAPLTFMRENGFFKRVANFSFEFPACFERE